MNLAALVAGVSLAVLMLLILHWFPWETFLGQQLGKLPSYIAGTTVLVAGFVVWAIISDECEAAIALAVIVTCGGTSVVGATVIDRIAGGVAKGRRAEKVIDGRQ